MKIVAIIQARINSSRLKGKVILPLAGKHMLWHVVDRANRAKMVDEVVLSYPENDADALWSSCNGATEILYCGDENDLIGRFYEAGQSEEADIIVRLCADNPLVEPSEIDRAVEYFLEQPRVFVSNMHCHSMSAMMEPELNLYPDGIGCEVFSMSTLKWLHESVKDPILREHLHKYFHDYSLVESPMCPKEFARPDLRLCMDTKEDYEFVSDIFNALYEKNPQFSIVDVIKYLDDKKCQAE